MKRTTQLILFLMIVSISLLPACGAQSSTGVTTPPNADHLVKFDKDGIAVLHGQLSGGSFDTRGTPKEVLQFLIPVKVEGMEVALEISFTVRPETELTSSLTPQTTARDYNNFHSNSGIYHALPPGARTEIIFQKKDAEFEAVSFQEVTKKPLFQKRAVIDNVFSTDVLSKGTVNGYVTQALNHNDGTIAWRLSVPIDVQGIKAAVILPVQSTPDTQVVTTNGVVPVNSQFSWGAGVQIQFTRKGDQLIADKITVIP